MLTSDILEASRRRFEQAVDRFRHENDMLDRRFHPFSLSPSVPKSNLLQDADGDRRNMRLPAYSGTGRQISQPSAGLQLLRMRP